MEWNLGVKVITARVKLLLPWSRHLLKSCWEGLLVKVFVSESLPRADSGLAVVVDKQRHEVKGRGRGLRDHLLEADPGGVGEGDLAEVREGGDPGPHLLGGCAQVPDDQAQLVDVVLAGEQGAVVEELGQHAAHGPEVDTLGVVPGPVQELRGPIPPCGHLQQENTVREGYNG